MKKGPRRAPVLSSGCLSGVSSCVERCVYQQAGHGDHLGGGVHQVPAAGVTQLVGSSGVEGVIGGGSPLGAGYVVTVVVIHSQNVLHGQDVAVGSKT
jgi:hypothetical protein